MTLTFSRGKLEFALKMTTLLAYLLVFSVERKSNSELKTVKLTYHLTCVLSGRKGHNEQSLKT
jgi:hypothetical protein